ncbi:MAG TPA: MotA/TolQ/ExbB proton channel family protein [Candidatus Methylacidiphilales bacterium]|jgi:biopolymer transport protein ExbB|nr:MotA/TolQ/ExbB proton channel family protein [Candidatus Methylacidiphilales bacterium]
MSSIRSTPLKAGLFTLVLLASSLLVNSLPAQDTGTPAAGSDTTTPAAGSDTTTPAAGSDTGEAPPAPPKPVTVEDMLSNGGPVMYVLAVASVCLFWFTVEGFVILRAVKLAPPVLIARIREAFKAGNYQEAWNICKANKCFLANVLANGLERIGRSKDAVDFVVEETALREANDLKTNTTYLSVIGVVSPMIGLTGTVWGMIGAFRALGENGITNPSALAGKIGEVLIATMSGLVVAVPAFVCFYVLRARAQSAILHAESQVYRLLDDIPYDQLSGVRIGDGAQAGAASKSRAMRSGVSQKVVPSVTTNCPACNAPITVGTTPCPNCQTALNWGAA